MAGIRREDARMKIPALIHLSRIGYDYLPRKEIRRDRRANLLTGVLGEALSGINGRPLEEETLGKLTEALMEQLTQEDRGEAFHRTLREGWQGWKLLDFEHPERNRFQAAAEVTCGHGGGGFRPDITLFVNGLPLGMIEVKTREQAGGIRAEYDRMLARLGEKEARPYLQAAQVWAFSNDRENDPDRILPTEGAYYAAAAGGDFPLYAFREEHPTRTGGLRPRDPETERAILADCGVRKTGEGEGAGRGDAGEFTRQSLFRGDLSPRTPTHRMLTGLFRPERFLFLIRYGVLYQREAGARTPERRLLTSGQLFALWDLAGKLRRGYRNWEIPVQAAAGEMGLAASLIRWTEDRLPGRRFCWIAANREDRARTAEALEAFGIRTGRGRLPSGEAELTLAEASAELPKRFREEKEDQETGPRVFLMPADWAETRAGRRTRAGLRRAAPEGIQIVWHRAGVPKKGGHFVYMLACADGTLYCGWTNDLENRLRTHNAGRGAKYTRSRRPVRLVYAEEYDTREEAMSREWHLKRLSRARKEELIRNRDGTAERGKGSDPSAGKTAAAKDETDSPAERGNGMPDPPAEKRRGKEGRSE